MRGSAACVFFIARQDPLVPAAALLADAGRGDRWHDAGAHGVAAAGARAAVGRRSLRCWSAGCRPLGDVLIRPLEKRFPARGSRPRRRPSPASSCSAARRTVAPSTPRELAALNEAAERYTEAVALARRLPERAAGVHAAARAPCCDAEPPEAETAGAPVRGAGDRQGAHHAGEQVARHLSRTRCFTARLLDPKPGERWLLVTSAWHMPRAMGCFRRAGFAVEAWPVDYRAPAGLR